KEGRKTMSSVFQAVVKTYALCWLQTDKWGKEMKKHRWSIVFLIAAGVIVNYFDRINMSIAMPLLQKEFHLTAGQMGIFLSAFAWSYALLQIPVGPLLDKIGVKWVTRVATVIWAAACLLTA